MTPKRAIIAFLGLMFIIVAIDEYSYSLWKRVYPGVATWGSVDDTHAPPIWWPNRSLDTTYGLGPGNGYRPAGGI